MFYALNKNGLRVDAYEAVDDEKYVCPICGNSVILKRGAINVAHFAHKANVCEDKWNYDMSEWHKRMQNYFPKDSQEVVVSYRGKKHRADVLIGDVVLEFQFSSITATEFEERTEFFKKAGYRLAWIFNLSEISNDDLYPDEPYDDKATMHIWKHPMRIFANCDYLGDNNKKFALWFSFAGDEGFHDTGCDYIERVVWAIKDDYGYSMQRFFTSPHGISMEEKYSININHFFYSKRDFFKEKVLELKNKHSFVVKYIGKRGEPRQSYICPRKNGEFGIDMWGEKGCSNCKYCYMAARTKKDDVKMYASYCCYPTQVRKLQGMPSEYECGKVDIFEI